MIGWALSSKENISLELNPVFWKQVFNLKLDIEDLKHLDKFRYGMLKDVLAGNYETTFEADLGNGLETELCEGGSQISVTADNRHKFVSLYLEKYFALDKPITDALISGIRLTA